MRTFGEMKKLVRSHIVVGLGGDDLERATAAFRNCTPEQMKHQYGESGQTRQEILDGYRKERQDSQNLYKEMADWIDNLQEPK